MSSAQQFQGSVVELFKNATVDAVSAVTFHYLSTEAPINIYAMGDFGGGTVTFEALAPNGQWVPITGGAFTEPEMRLLSAFPFTGRAVLSDSVDADVTVILNGVVIEVVVA